MQIVEVAREPGRLIEQFGSLGARHLGGARFTDSGGLAFLSLAEGSHLGRHPTVLAQLFCVVSGDGWVAGAEAVRHPIRAGQAALWAPGEEHESGSTSGMAVVVLEAPRIDIR